MNTRNLWKRVWLVETCGSVVAWKQARAAHTDVRVIGWHAFIHLHRRSKRMDYIQYKERLEQLRDEYAAGLKTLASFAHGVDLIDRSEAQVDSYRLAVELLKVEYRGQVSA
jgi:hypothetical protein